MRRIEYEPPLCICKGCYYWRGMYSTNACHYRIETGKLRGIPPIECYKHKGTPYRKGKRKYAEDVHKRDLKEDKDVR